MSISISMCFVLLCSAHTLCVSVFRKVNKLAFLWVWHLMFDINKPSNLMYFIFAHSNLSVLKHIDFVALYSFLYIFTLLRLMSHFPIAHHPHTPCYASPTFHLYPHSETFHHQLYSTPHNPIPDEYFCDGTNEFRTIN